jgi:hypothetical protein
LNHDKFGHQPLHCDKEAFELARDILQMLPSEVE